MRSKVEPAVTLLIMLQVIVLLSLWTGVGKPNVAMAQIPDSGAQRAEIIDQLKLINANLDKIGSYLSGGKLQVRVINSDDKKTP